MKKRIVMLALALAVTLGLSACGNEAKTAENNGGAGGTGKQQESPEEPKDSQEEKGEMSAEEKGETPEESKSTEAPAGVEYQNISFDHEAEITGYHAKSTEFTTPEAAKIGVTVTDEKSATGVQLAASVDESNTTDYYLNALVAGNELTFTGDITSATSQIGTGDVTDLPVDAGSVKAVPAVISASDPQDEIFTFTMTDGTEYKVHTVSETIADMDVVTDNSADEGVYTFAIDKFLIRVNTEGNLVYYRNVGCVGAELMAENLGWGLNAILDSNPETINDHPVFSDYNPVDNKVAFELCVSRNPLIQSKEACFSYRTYKNAD